ncbi:phosphoserine phosphatase SerB [Sphingomonas sp. CGMCC 1.13654]|uniref:Phosphoserine phosphatase n=1 Tax=Sphingomonas chungangi TaxID=2683589 RepID=A0A838LCD2_9SPHN|nr:phosphoserine phosphatase SerB [Sphingomonas chungangi]MBA2936510.1 phosphoserine phosphatase SerB [Sphingomonas chungangi]MVW55895.1 phosphoserine phosphatase SerB [Sphingomonas chungangi]
MFTATLIAAEGQGVGDLDLVSVLLAEQGCISSNPAEWQTPVWIDEGYAIDFAFDQNPAAAREVLEGELGPIDVIVQPAANRRKKLLVADMDSTMITVECIDELADYAGIKDRIAAVTEAAMRGELDFAEALDARVALLKDLEASAIDRCRAERVRLMPGAKALIRTMKAHGARTVLVSGGFTVFAEPVAAEIGFDVAIANRLGIAGDRLDGLVAKPIVDAATKRITIEAERMALGLEVSETLAVGDGANDIPMIQAAGLGVAYHAKPKTAAAAGARVDHGDLTALLWAQGYKRSEWVTD